jgi:cell wall-associated NlpC family hydrolase
VSDLAGGFYSFCFPARHFFARKDFCMNGPKRLVLTEYLSLFIGSVYQWGGSGPYNVGFDCSGLVLEGLSMVGLWGKGDATSQGIYDHFAPTKKKILPSQARTGCLLFFGKNLKSITHIAVAMNSEYMIEAGGGNSKSVNKGMVRVRPLGWRKDLVGVLDIFEE